MRNFLLAAVAAAAIASPAAARDGSAYIEGDLGVMLAEDTKLDFDDGTIHINNAVAPDYNTGWDVGLVGGYDWGMIRTELDLSYKHAGVNEVVLGDGACAPTTPAEQCIVDSDGDASVLAIMGNVLLDFGDENGVNGFVGAGVGFASVNVDTDFNDDDFGFDDKDSAFAWQFLAGLRFPINPNLDAGLKYRFLNSRELDFGSGSESLTGHWRSHSLLATLTRSPLQVSRLTTPSAIITTTTRHVAGRSALASSRPLATCST